LNLILCNLLKNKGKNIKLVLVVRIVQIGHLPPSGLISSIIALTPSHHQQLTTGRQQEISLPTSDRSVGEMNFLKSGFEPNQTKPLLRNNPTLHVDKTLGMFIKNGQTVEIWLTLV
jgi:hypothetical protein